MFHKKKQKLIINVIIKIKLLKTLLANNKLVINLGIFLRIISMMKYNQKSHLFMY